MTRRVVVRAAAKRDIREARAWYSGISRALGDDVIAAIDEAIARATEYPEAFPVVRQGFRRVLLRRFPYALFYVLRDDRLIVAAVLHQARDPFLLDRRR
ncbi:MAG TPA: type II toxin-antitoxin system RelE/ParE family toxin [Thermoanaerobaculia bacterium]|jgi:plasmid stabilization system protein ParE